MFNMVTGAVFKKRHPQVGARPGTLVIEADAPQPKVRMINYTKSDVGDHEVTDLSKLAIALETSSVTWVDVQGFGDESVIQQIGKTFFTPPVGHGRRRQRAAAAQERSLWRPIVDYCSHGEQGWFL